MPILNSNEKYTRDLSSRIANLTGLSYSAVRAVIDGIELCILDDLRTKSLDSDITDRVHIPIEIPNIGTIILNTHFYPKDKSLEDYTDGRSFKSKFEINKKFLSKLRWAYYARYDYLSERAEKNFSELFNNHYQSIISGEDGED